MNPNAGSPWRTRWRQAHRWTALAFGALLALIGSTGTFLVLARPLDEWANARLFRHPPSYSAAQYAEPLRLESVRSRLTTEFGEHAALTFRLPRIPTDTLHAIVRVPAGWSGTLYLNPHTGDELGRRGEYEGAVNLVFKFHSALLLGETGRTLLAAAACAYLAILLSGLRLWWPHSRPPSFRIEHRRGWTRTLFDLHRVMGGIFGLFIALTVVSGTYMAWPPLSRFVTRISGTPAVTPPVIDAGKPVSLKATADDYLRQAGQAFPGARITYLQIPAGISRPIRVRALLPDDPHPNGRSSVWLHPGDARTLATHRWNEVDPGARALSFLYPLHTGQLGGTILEALVAIGGAILTLLGLSGLWMWWRQRRPSRTRPTRR